MCYHKLLFFLAWLQRLCQGAIWLDFEVCQASHSIMCVCNVSLTPIHNANVCVPPMSFHDVPNNTNALAESLCSVCFYCTEFVIELNEGNY